MPPQDGGTDVTLAESREAGPHAAGSSDDRNLKNVAPKAAFYKPELDCLRFAAFFAVFVHHSFPKTADFYVTRNLPPLLADVAYGGAFGVDLFFCLSAYLITELLVREKELVGVLNIRAFYMRRLLRIWPLYFTFVFFSYGLTFVDSSQVFSPLHLAMFMFLLGNWAAASDGVRSVVVPLWSVSFEEQFYLFWPLIVRKASRRQMVGVCGVMIAVAFLYRHIIMRTVTNSHGLIWNGTFSHLDAISYGILLSLARVSERMSIWLRSMLALLGCGAWVCAAELRDRGDVMMALAALGSVAILRAAIGLRLNHRWLVRLGVVSYGLYVYHEFLLHYVQLALPATLTHTPKFVVWWIVSFAGTILVALASYRWLEMPFLRLKERFAIVRSRPL